MGIRGTAPHVEILEDGTVKFTTLVEENKKNEQTKCRRRLNAKRKIRRGDAPRVGPMTASQRRRTFAGVAKEPSSSGMIVVKARRSIGRNPRLSFVA